MATSTRKRASLARPVKKAKLFQNGGSQAVRIPSEYRFDTDDVQIEQVGNLLIIRPAVQKGWASFFELPPAAEDFLEDREQGDLQDRELF